MGILLSPPVEATEPAVPLVEELTPAPDPWDAARRLAHWPHLLFLDSAAADSPWSRYSFVTADPFAWLRARGPDLVSSTLSPRRPADPFAAVAEVAACFPARTVPGLPPF